MQFDSATLHWLWRQTTDKLESLARDVRENKRVLEAADFARWVQFSGILKLFDAFPTDGPLQISAAIIRKQIRDLLFECGELFRMGKADPKYSASDISEINRKLDLIAAHVATLSAVAPVAPVNVIPLPASESASDQPGGKAVAL